MITLQIQRADLPSGMDGNQFAMMAGAYLIETIIAKEDLSTPETFVFVIPDGFETNMKSLQAKGYKVTQYQA